MEISAASAPGSVPSPSSRNARGGWANRSRTAPPRSPASASTSAENRPPCSGAAAASAPSASNGARPGNRPAGQKARRNTLRHFADGQRLVAPFLHESLGSSHDLRGTRNDLFRSHPVHDQRQLPPNNASMTSRSGAPRPDSMAICRQIRSTERSASSSKKAGQFGGLTILSRT